MPRLVVHRPRAGPALLLGLLPMAVLLLAYLMGSASRLESNPNDKLLPSLAQMGATAHRLATEPDRRSGKLVLWADTGASLRRLAIGVGVSAVVGLVLGVAIGALPLFRALMSPFVATLSMVPPLAILPILFIVFGLGELAKVMLIVIGISPFLTRELALRVGELPREQLVKALTLGASSWQLLVRVVLPQALPRLFDAVRLSLGAAWLFLIAAEAIASTDGLGYRIFLVRRYLAMDVILPYVAWITLLAFAVDRLLAAASRSLFPWFHVAGERP